MQRFGLGDIGDEAIRSMFKQVDKNGNGRLEFMEAFKVFQLIQEKIKEMGGGSTGGDYKGNFSINFDFEKK